LDPKHYRLNQVISELKIRRVERCGKKNIEYERQTNAAAGERLKAAEATITTIAL
jgi:hypothetical protein